MQFKKNSFNSFLSKNSVAFSALKTLKNYYTNSKTSHVSSPDQFAF